MNRYDNRKSREAMGANSKQRRLEAEHSANDAFVKKVQNEQAKHGGRTPDLKDSSMHFNAYMCNNGEHAQELARDITKGLDKTAFPVK
jgi:hypothetical protein